MYDSNKLMEEAETVYFSEMTPEQQRARDQELRDFYEQASLEKNLDWSKLCNQIIGAEIC